IIARILASWFAGSGSQPSAAARILRLLERLTDPYLAFFRRCKVFRLGHLDFSPVVALIALSVAGNIFASLAAFQQITVGIVLSLFLARLWAAAAFFLNMLILLILLRLAAHFMRVNPAGPFWRYIDMILIPVLDPIARFLFRGRGVHYIPGGHIAGGLFLLAARLLGAFLVDRLVMLVQRLPF
ncbi:MAG: YggT family protein, partial [Spirochaetaceae bacterium]|nr:YggT family protein [Spirochaetaceae bacterium]